MPLAEFDLSKPKCDPKLLLDSGPPRALYRVNPRTIFGKTWWDEVRTWAYKKYQNSCAACGKRHTKLEAHEVYNIDKKKARISIKDIVPLCYDCHSFIHQDMHRVMLKRGELKHSDVVRIIAHGTNLLKKYKIRNFRKDPNDSGLLDSKWRLEVNGKLYSWDKDKEIYNVE
jgi:hypothetical protein